VSSLAILVTTIDTTEKARELARAVLARRLAACVQVSPITSHYHWKGDICESDELLLQMKHRVEDYDELAELVRSLHSYETPEILRIDIAKVELAYANWLRDSTERA
jgi:periplasmic divalent cation tolerance protein